MAAIVVPANPELNINHVEEIKQSDFVVYNFVNGYYLTFLSNDQYLNNRITSKAEELTNAMEALRTSLNSYVNRVVEEMRSQIEQSAVQECTNAEIDAVLTRVFGSV